MASNGTELTLPPIPPNIAHLTTPILFGTLLDYLLFGILTVQAYVYYYSFPDDKRGIKILIWSIYLIELAQVCSAAAAIWYRFGAGYGNMIKLDTTYVSPFDTPLLGALVALIVQLFFCYRIWKLRKNDWYIIVCVIIVVLSLLQGAGGLILAIDGHIRKFFSAVRSADKKFSMWLVGEAVADTLIAVTMAYLLLGSTNECSIQSRSVINRIIRLVIQTNSLTAGAAILSVMFFFVYQDANYFLTTTIILGKLYSNSLLATFNHRIFLRRSVEEVKLRSSCTSDERHMQEHP